MDHPILLSLFAFLALMVLMSWVGYRLFYKQGRYVKAQIGAPVITGQFGTMLGEGESESSTLVTFLHQLGSKVPSSEAEVAQLRALLIRAGFRSDHAMPVFYGVRIMSTLGMLVFCL